MKKLTIGKLAVAANVGVETVRFYERRGLIKKPATHAGAFRVYAPETVSKLRFIRRAQELGFTLKEVKELLLLDQNTRATCDHVSARATKKIEEVRTKIEDLRRMEAALAKLVSACEADSGAKACCRVSDCFENRCSKEIT